MIYFTSDLHLFHNKEFLYKPRGFNCVEDMVETLIKNWNETVSDEDEVYVLGDLMLNDNLKGLEALKQLKGRLHIILGNHDTDTRVELYRTLPQVIEIKYATIIKYNKYRFYLSHYPTFTASCDDKPLNKKLINLYGHTHQKDNFYNNSPFMYHVGLDSHDMELVSIDKIIEDCTNKINYEKKISGSDSNNSII